MASRSTCGSSSVGGTRVQRDGCRGGVNQRGDPLPAAPSLSLCACEGSAWQQACDLAPSTTPRREARPGVTDPLTGCSPSSLIHSFLTSPFL
ncbi:hypothetical protein CgunFtcFv8_013768 [Champsocephalus gunnari]|uniref:Uncharacterized protein n=1 Tax=Champsocephalus gunnari TaxID=52237 RepID=A0AAN8HY13_CHAGU|nr:hypothetical protein CgunFtcFv8_013768 [Champsocephalus gunnari]